MNTTPKGRTRRSSKQKVENSNLEENLPPVVTMADNRTMAELLRAPTEGYAEAIVVPLILAEQFELKHSLIYMMTSDQFFGLEKDNPHDHIRCKPIASQVKACDVNSNSDIAKLTHAVNQQTSVVTTAMTTMLKQFQATPPSAPVKAVKEICVTRGGAHPYYQCLTAGGNTFPEFRDNIQGYVSAAACNDNQGNLDYRPQCVATQMRPPATSQPNQNFHLNELEKIKRMNEVNMKAMQNQIDMVKNELRNEMKTSIQTSLSNQTNEIKNMMASLLQMNTASTSGSRSLPSNTVANPKGKLKAITTSSGLVTDGPTVLTPPKSVTLEVGERVEETYTDPDLAEYTIKEKLQELANTPLNENCSAIIMKKLPKKLGDPRKFLILCGFSELKCKALANLGASINLMPLSVWKELGLPELIPTRMTLELANRAICTPAGIARDVFVPVGKFTFLADFVIVDYESDPRVPLILGRPFLRTARALIDVHGEEMILCDDDERLTLNMKHDTSSYSNQPQRELVNLINIFNVLSEDFLEVSVSNQPSGNPTFSLHQELTSPEVNHDIHNSEGCNEIHPYFDDNPLSGSTTYSANSLLEEFTDELALITYPPDYDANLQFDIESDLKQIEFLLYQGKDSSLKDSIDQTNLANLEDNFVDPIPEMFTNKHASDYSSPLIFDVYDDDFLEVESDADNVYDDPFDSKGEKIKESKLLIDELDLPCDFLPYSEYDSFNAQDFSRFSIVLSLRFEKKIQKEIVPGLEPGTSPSQALVLTTALGRPFLRTVRALIDVHGEEMILRDGDERLTLNMKHDTVSYSNHPYKESVKLINIFNLSSEDCLKDLVSNKQSSNPTFSLHKEIASPEVIPEFHDSKGCTFSSEELPDIDSFNDIHPYFDDDPLSGSTTYSANSLLEEFTDELALISYPLDYDDNRACDIEDNVLFSPDNEDKVFNPGIISHEKSVKIITQEKKLKISFVSWLSEDFDTLFSELIVFKEVPNSYYSSQSSTTLPSTHVPLVTYQLHFIDNTQLDSGLFPMDNLNENLTNTLALLTQSYKTYLPQTNNQLITSSNTRNQATVQDGRVVVQSVQGQQNRGQGNNARGTGAAGNGGAQNRVGNANPGQARQIKCYNYNAQENGVVLDEEQLLFIAGGQDNVVDEDVDELSVQNLSLKTMFMANLSSTDPVYDEAGPSYDSNILSEYVKDNAEPVVQNNVSSVPNDV
nr:reverse transcriptase domain-containing protein [Tanacetum cinerariifolium]